MPTRHILVVDDEPDVRLMIRTYLQWAGDYEVLEAKCGEEAVRLASQHPIDLVLGLLKKQAAWGSCQSRSAPSNYCNRLHNMPSCYARCRPREKVGVVGKG